jgi:hypothetical protein
MTTQFPEDPLTYIKTWQTKFNGTCNLDPSLLCDPKQKTIDEFLDTICSGLEELSGKEVFNCFVEAVQIEHNQKQKEYNKVIELKNMLTEVQR